MNAGEGESVLLFSLLWPWPSGKMYGFRVTAIHIHLFPILRKCIKDHYRNDSLTQGKDQLGLLVPVASVNGYRTSHVWGECLPAASLLGSSMVGRCLPGGRSHQDVTLTTRILLFHFCINERDFGF